jgi:hypothetical protein
MIEDRSGDPAIGHRRLDHAGVGILAESREPEPIRPVPVVAELPIIACPGRVLPTAIRDAGPG